MRTIQELFSDMFDARAITDNRLMTYAVDHFSKLESNNPGAVFDTIITNTDTAINNFGEAMGLESGNVGDRKGETIMKELAKTAFKEFIRKKEGLIKSTFGVQSLQYSQFFPDGLSAFNRATDLDFIGLVKLMMALAFDRHSYF